MPLHDHECEKGHRFERTIPLAELDDVQTCECGAPAKRVFLKFPAAFVQADIHYTSPIDGRPITSKQARLEDMARNNCMEYDPAMKQDVLRNRKAADDHLDKVLDQTVEA